jgi:hypothetical protein
MLSGHVKLRMLSRALTAVLAYGLIDPRPGRFEGKPRDLLVDLGRDGMDTRGQAGPAVGQPAQLMFLHVDLAVQRVTPIPPHYRRAIAALAAEHAALPVRPAAGRGIALTRPG